MQDSATQGIQTVNASILVHGTGGLALGLIARQLALNEREFTLFGRLGEDEKRRQNVECLNRRRIYLSGVRVDQAIEIPIPDMAITSSPVGLACLRIALRADGDVIYFTSLREGQPWAAGEVADAIQDRQRNNTPGTLFLFPCENSIHPKISRLETDFGGNGFAYVDSMVDRICPDVGVISEPHRTGSQASDGIVFVDTEEEFEWVAKLETDDPRAHSSFNSICHALNIENSIDVEAAKIRKRWMMNGTQLSIGLLAATHGFREKHLRDYCEQYPDSLESLIGDFRIACELSGIAYPKGELEKAEAWYTRRLLMSLQSGEDGKGDTVLRILNKAYKESAGQMLRDIADKIGDPYSVLSIHLHNKVERTSIHEVMEVALGQLLSWK
ncbi:Uncharacterised protein [Mycobacteroides abscessus subsp. abscessus]|uniref:hypothetical protein n=1 Tax=Mycobacteroides abscessus TaxID=36809 RepID=UPI00092C04CB|nr:hypothetical protein [Mycobacteroides abscessus]SHU42402.1 Uncharacterised protein [Mycobacteroides abscessus subsp. abscessus]SHV13126.1 Uncharacterised protein [Mycobacteroides abscessus subsp. abscessus]